MTNDDVMAASDALSGPRHRAAIARRSHDAIRRQGGAAASL